MWDSSWRRCNHTAALSISHASYFSSRGLFDVGRIITHGAEESRINRTCLERNYKGTELPNSTKNASFLDVILILWAQNSEPSPRKPIYRFKSSDFTLDLLQACSGSVNRGWSKSGRQPGKQYFQSLIINGIPFI